MSKISRSRTRKYLYQILYASVFNEINKSDFKDSFFSWKFESELDEKYLNEMLLLVREKEPFLIEILKLYAPKFNVKNMDLEYVLPIFIWATEMLFYSEEIPAKVSINEAIEIAKIYSDDSARKIVNWVLNSILRDLEKLQEQFKTFNPTSNNYSYFK